MNDKQERNIMTGFRFFLPTALGVFTAVALVQTVVVAKPAPEINRIAQAITVRIAVGEEHGSGILLKKNGDVYTVLTAAHVLTGGTAKKLTIVTADDESHNVTEIRKYQGNVDLAIVRFRSARNYRLAELGDSNRLTGGMNIYVGGFPMPTRVITERVFVFKLGRVVANSKRVFQDGYALLYDNSTLPGMSGGPILDETGKVVAIHGRGDRAEDTNAKTGFNAGIPSAQFTNIASGFDVSKASSNSFQSSTSTADDYFVSGYQKSESKDYRGALDDYSQLIALQPNNALAYINCGNLKHEKLDDLPGALADYNQSIAIQPDNALAYYNRGNLKYKKLNNKKEAIVDFSKAELLFRQQGEIQQAEQMKIYLSTLLSGDNEVTKQAP
jgi:S1-C subfamily serine protease